MINFTYIHDFIAFVDVNSLCVYSTNFNEFFQRTFSIFAMLIGNIGTYESFANYVESANCQENYLLYKKKGHGLEDIFSKPEQ